MDKVKIVLNREGVRELLQSQAIMDICKSYADRAVAQLGDGYEVSTMVGKTRVNAEVAAVSYAAKVENSQTNSILKAVGGVK